MCPARRRSGAGVGVGEYSKVVTSSRTLARLTSSGACRCAASNAFAALSARPCAAHARAVSTRYRPYRSTVGSWAGLTAAADCRAAPVSPSAVWTPWFCSRVPGSVP